MNSFKKIVIYIFIDFSQTNALGNHAMMNGHTGGNGAGAGVRPPPGDMNNNMSQQQQQQQGQQGGQGYQAGHVPPKGSSLGLGLGLGAPS